MQFIDNQVIENGMSYATYRQLITDLMAQNKTTGNDHSEAMLHYTDLNIQRMNRLDRKSRLTEQTIDFMKNYDRPITWLVLTEGWCGDAAQVIPVLNHLAELTENVQLKLILRDEYLDIIDVFLTNGGRSIPKLIILDRNTNEVLGSWGPRPTDAQQLMLDAKDTVKTIEDKEERKAFFGKVKADLQRWYARDKTIHTQEEIVAALTEVHG